MINMLTYFLTIIEVSFVFDLLKMSYIFYHINKKNPEKLYTDFYENNRLKSFIREFIINFDIYIVFRVTVSSFSFHIFDYILYIYLYISFV